MKYLLIKAEPAVIKDLVSYYNHMYIMNNNSRLKNLDFIRRYNKNATNVVIRDQSIKPSKNLEKIVSKYQGK